MDRRKFVKVAISGVAGTAPLWGTSARAQAEAGYPSRAVKMIVPYAAGSGSDVLARVIAAKLADTFGKPMVVENRTGASGILGVDAVVKAPADGYTLLATSGSAISINPLIFRKLPYDPGRDLAPISQIGVGAAGLIINTSLNARTMKEFVEIVRAQPGKFSYGSFGIGSGTHIALESLKRREGLDLAHVAYRGTAPAITDLLGGQVHAVIADLVTAKQHIDAGRLRMLAVTGDKRSLVMPEVATFGEAGYGYLTDTYARFGVYAPAGTPAAILQKLSAEIIRAAQAVDLQQRFTPLGYELAGSTPAAFAETLARDAQRWGRLVADLGGLSLEQPS